MSFLDTLCDSLSRQHFDEPVEITLTRNYQPTQEDDDYWNSFRASDDIIFDAPDAVDPMHDTVDLSEVQMNGVLDQIFGEWEAEEKGQATNPDRLPYDPRMGF